MDNLTNVTDPCSEEIPSDYNIGLHVAALFVIFACSAAGVLCPIVFARVKNDFIQRILFAAKFFGAGVILCTAVIHIYPEAVETLGSECLPQWFLDYPTAGLFVLIALLGIHFVEWLSMYIFGRDEDETSATRGGNDPETGGSSPKSVQMEQEAHSLLLGVEQKHHNISTYSLEMAIMVHSVIIGVTLGVSAEEFVALWIALCFHQFFEGVGLGSMICKVDFSNYCLAYVNGLVYALTTPVGVAIGIGIRAGPSSPTARYKSVTNLSGL